MIFSSSEKEVVFAEPVQWQGQFNMLKTVHEMSGI